jgi:hypothetical protein
MSFSKAAMQKELLSFLALYGQQVEKMYGASEGAWLTKESLEDSPICRGVNAMFDYGICGIPSQDLSPGSLLDGLYAHTERFVRSMDSTPMRIYLAENDNALPKMAKRAVQAAVARLVLDGGDRSTDYAFDEFGPGKGDFGYLTLPEVALLADMDERSVRNAANPKLADPLKTVQIGKRSLVEPKEAQRWLEGRKGFIATRVVEGLTPHRPPTYNIGITQAMFDLIAKEAKKTGQPFDALIKKSFFDSFESAMNAEKNGEQS